MKKKLFITLLSTLLFSSCFQPVFYNISKDVAPETATVVGIINSIVRYKVGETEYLVVAANGGIRYKKASDNYHSPWLVYGSLPFTLTSFHFDTSSYTGESVIKVLADKKNLYIVSTSYRIDENLGITVPSIVSVYAKEIKESTSGIWSLEGGWNRIMSGPDYFKFSIYQGYVYSDFNSFCTNSVKPENRKAYIRSGSKTSYSNNKAVKYYELGNPNETEITNTITAFETNDKSKNINSAVILGGQTLFFNSIASTTNETPSKDATYAYFGDGYQLRYTDGTNNNLAILNCGAPISCLAACKNALLIGRGDYSDIIISTIGGMTQTSLNDTGIPGSTLQPSSIANTDTQLSTSYIILSLLNVDPSKTELGSTLYASLGFAGSGSSTNSSVNYNRIGLWSYYPSRGNWNCE